MLNRSPELQQSLTLILYPLVAIKLRSNLSSTDRYISYLVVIYLKVGRTRLALNLHYLTFVKTEDTRIGYLYGHPTMPNKSLVIVLKLLVVTL